MRIETLAIGLVAALAGPALAQSDGPPVARAELQLADGSPAGSAQFTQLPAGLLVEVELQNVTPGAHGIHIHETGTCSPDFAAAGDHAAPDGTGHGFAATDAPHAGDLPNIIVAADGTAAAHFLNPRASLSDGEGVLLDTDGAALVVHAKPDSYQAEAGAGDREVCGVIRVEG